MMQLLRLVPDQQSYQDYILLFGGRKPNDVCDIASEVRNFILMFISRRLEALLGSSWSPLNT